MKTKTFVSLQQKTNDLTNDKTLASVSKFSLNIRYIDAIGHSPDSVFSLNAILPSFSMQRFFLPPFLFFDQSLADIFISVTELCKCIP